MASSAVLAKAGKFLCEERVRFVVPGREWLAEARVVGETGTYTVGFDGRSWHCSCPCSHSKCAHITAATIVYRAIMDEWAEDHA